MSGGGKSGLARIELLLGKNEREILEAMMLVEEPCTSTNMTLLEVDYGRVILRGVPRAQHYNLLGTVHGGWFSTLLNSALGLAMQTTLPAGSRYATAELSTKIVRSASQRAGPLRAVGRVIRHGGVIATAQAHIEDEKGRLYARAASECFVYNVLPAD